MLELSVRPKTIVELRFLRHWLHQLSGMHFSNGKFAKGGSFYNPECVQPLNAEFIQELLPWKNEKDFAYFSFGTLEVCFGM